MGLDIQPIPPELNDDGEWIIHQLIDENKDFDFSGIKVNDKIFSEDVQMVDTYLPIIVNEYKYKVNKFILVTDYGEAFSSKERHVIEESLVNKKVIKYFKENNLLDRLVWRSNGLNPQFKSEIKFEPISFWLGRNIEHCVDITPPKIDYGRYGFLSFVDRRFIVSHTSLI